MATSANRFVHRTNVIDRLGRTVVYAGELLRHPVYTRFLHWMVGIFFFLALLSGFGIYLGRMLHWNSWDVVASPAALAGEVSDKMLNPVSNTSAWAVSAIYGVGLVLGYLALRGIASAFHDREISRSA